MMAKVSKMVQEPEKVVKKKTWKARLKKDAHNPPEYDKVNKKSAANDVRSPLDRIRHWGRQRGLYQTFHFTYSVTQLMDTIVLGS